jgi:hypothetical protein
VSDISQTDMQRLAQLLHAAHRDASSFSVALQPDGLVRVSGPRGTAFYPRDNWLELFARHLHKSFFDPQVPPPAGPRLSRKQAISASA